MPQTIHNAANVASHTLSSLRPVTRRKGEEKTMATGFADLDALLEGGLARGEIVALFASETNSCPGSALTLQIAHHVAARLKYRVLYLTLATTVEEKVRELLQVLSFLNPKEMHRGMLDALGLAQLRATVATLQDDTLLFATTPGRSVEESLDAIKTHVAEDDVDLIIIDGLTSPTPEAERALKEMAAVPRSHPISHAIVLLVNAPVGETPESVDVVMSLTPGVSNDPDTARLAELRLLRNGNRQPATVRLGYSTEFRRFSKPFDRELLVTAAPHPIRKTEAWSNAHQFPNSYKKALLNEIAFVFETQDASARAQYLSERLQRTLKREEPPEAQESPELTWTELEQLLIASTDAEDAHCVAMAIEAMFHFANRNHLLLSEGPWQRMSDYATGLNLDPLATARLACLSGRWVVLDVETSGLRPAVDRVLKVSAAHYLRGNIVRAAEWFVFSNTELTDTVERITRVKPEQIKNGEPFPHVCKQLSEFIGHTTVVTHNLAFMRSFLEAEAQRSEFPLPVWQQLCTYCLAKERFPDERRSLDALAENLQLKIREENLVHCHDAVSASFFKGDAPVISSLLLEITKRATSGELFSELEES